LDSSLKISLAYFIQCRMQFRLEKEAAALHK
jgi:hypothetical protein